MTPSVTQPLNPAWEWMLTVLFRPFDAGRWFILGLAVFLANLADGGSGGGGGNFQLPSGGGGGTPPNWQTGISWVETHVGLLVLIAVAGSVLVLAFTALLLWLGCHGHFITIDSLAKNRPEIQEPWRRTAPQANSLFRWRFGFVLVGWLVGFGGMALAVVYAWPDIASFSFGRRAVVSVVSLVLTLLPFGLLAAFATMILRDVFAPAMYARGWSVAQTWAPFRRDVFPRHFFTLVLYGLMRILLAIGVAMLLLVGCCLTCCIAALPYLGTVILLPVLLFPRCYALAFTRQFGPDWDVFTVLPPPPVSDLPASPGAA